jgi:hypothetical protein
MKLVALAAAIAKRADGLTRFKEAGRRLEAITTLTVISVFLESASWLDRTSQPIRLRK